MKSTYLYISENTMYYNFKTSTKIKIYNEEKTEGGKLSP